MQRALKRREFLIKGSQAGIACCAILMGARGLALGNSHQSIADEPIDPKKLTYCGYKCPADCTFLLASEKNDTELKKKVYQNWKFKEKYNIDFDPDKLFCFGCKNKEREAGVMLQHCTVRQCVISKGLDGCVECKELNDCQKELWNHFPDFRKKVIEMQKKYLSEKLA